MNTSDHDRTDANEIAAEHDPVLRKVNAFGKLQREISQILYKTFGDELTNLQRFTVMHELTNPGHYADPAAAVIRLRQLAEATGQLSGVYLAYLEAKDISPSRLISSAYSRASDAFEDAAKAFPPYPTPDRWPSSWLVFFESMYSPNMDAIMPFVPDGPLLSEVEPMVHDKTLGDWRPLRAEEIHGTWNNAPVRHVLWIGKRAL